MRHLSLSHRLRPLFLKLAFATLCWLWPATALAAEHNNQLQVYWPWLVATVVCTAASAFFAGTTLTRRRILRTLLVDQPRKTEKQATKPTDKLAQKRQQIMDLLLGDASSLFANCAEVRNFMCEQVETVDASDHRKIVIEQAESTGEHILFVCRNYRELAGVITTTDLEYRQGTVASQIMSSPPVSVTPQTSVQDAIGIMLERNLSTLPVCRASDGYLLGMITTSDLILTMECTFAVLQRLVNELSADGKHLVSQ